MKIGSVNVYGLAKSAKLHELYQFFIANEFDILMIQKVRKLTEDSCIWNNLNSFIYWWEIDGWFNGVGILYNPWRLSIKSQINTPQLMIVDIIDEIDQQNLLVCIYTSTPLPKIV